MAYTVKQLSDLANVSVRTLHFYDQIGLLKPNRIEKNGYRLYSEEELIRLQQILFFRELEFPLEDIKKILSSLDFEIGRALKEHKALIRAKIERLNRLTETINKTINKINKKKNMEDKDLYEGFDKEEMEKLNAEAKERWGHTEAYRQSVDRVKRMSKEDMARIQKAGDDLMKKIAANVDQGADSLVVQELIDQHYHNLGRFYEPNLKMYRGLADMYVQDHRFDKYFERFAPGMTKFMHDAMVVYCEKEEKLSVD